MKTNSKRNHEHKLVTMLSNGMPSALSLCFEDRITARKFYSYLRKLEIEVLCSVGLTDADSTDTDDVLILEDSFVHFNHLIEDLHVMRLVSHNTNQLNKDSTQCNWTFTYRNIIVLRLEIMTMEFNTNMGLQFNSFGTIKIFSMKDLEATKVDLSRKFGLSTWN
jgi:hypothetical protein